MPANILPDSARLQKWLVRRATTHPAAVILGSSANALVYSRSLGRHGIPTLVLDSHKGVAMYSRFGVHHVLPPIEEQADEWLSFLDSLGDRLDMPAVVCPTADPHLLFLSKHREQIGRRFRFIIPDHGTLQNILNKRAQYAIAEKAGIAIPKTFYPETITDLRAWISRNPVSMHPEALLV